jgi:hypothetical protein
LSLHLPDIQFDIFTKGFGHLLQQVGIVEAIQGSSRAWYLPAWGFGTSYGPDLTLVLVFIVIQPLEVYIVLSEHFVAALIVFIGSIC